MTEEGRGRYEALARVAIDLLHSRCGVDPTPLQADQKTVHAISMDAALLLSKAFQWEEGRTLKL